MIGFVKMRRLYIGFMIHKIDSLKAFVVILDKGTRNPRKLVVRTLTFVLPQSTLVTSSSTSNRK